MHAHGDRAAWLHGPAARCRDPGPIPARPWHIVLLGPPGVGKGTQADLIVRNLGACHLSTGDVFRAACRGGGTEASPLMRSAVTAMKRGHLVSDATVVRLVRERIGCLHCAHGFLLDGFPRTVEQAGALDAMLARVGTRLDAVLSLQASEATVMARLSGRRVCQQCKASWHIASRPPRVEGVCDQCGGELFQRDDDRPAAIRVRLEAYRATAEPLIEFYRAQGCLQTIPADDGPEEIFARITVALGELDAVPPDRATKTG